MTGVTMASMTKWPGSVHMDNSADQLVPDAGDGQDLDEHHQPFLHCQSAKEWYQVGYVGQHIGDNWEQSEVEVKKGGQAGDEIIFLV